MWFEVVALAFHASHQPELYQEPMQTGHRGETTLNLAEDAERTSAKLHVDV